jgi:hypothetical protein
LGTGRQLLRCEAIDRTGTIRVTGTRYANTGVSSYDINHPDLRSG